MSWKTIETENLLNTDFVSVNRNKVQLPDGAVIEDFYTVGIQDAAIVYSLLGFFFFLFRPSAIFVPPFY